MKNDKKLPETGPRGGKTTITKSGMVRKAIYLAHSEWEQLRRLAYEQNRPASEIVRAALSSYFAGLPKPAGGKRKT